MTNEEKMNEILENYYANEFNLAEVLREIFKNQSFFCLPIIFDIKTCLFKIGEEYPDHMYSLDGEFMRADIYGVSAKQFKSSIELDTFDIEDYEDIRALKDFDFAKIIADKEEEEEEEEEEVTWDKFLTYSHVNFRKEVEKLDFEAFLADQVDDFLEYENFDEEFHDYLIRYFDLR